MKISMILACVAAVALTRQEDRPRDTIERKSIPKDEVRIVKAADVKWTDAKGLPEGAKSCVLHGDPAKGASVVLLKFPAGMKVPAHWHSSDEVVTVTSGKVLFGTGETVDEAKGETVETGGYVVIPAKKPHWAIMQTEVLITKYSDGIGDYNLCK